MTIFIIHFFTQSTNQRLKVNIWEEAPQFDLCLSYAVYVCTARFNNLAAKCPPLFFLIIGLGVIVLSFLALGYVSNLVLKRDIVCLDFKKNNFKLSVFPPFSLVGRA